jgi:uncharacterized protein YbjT (DUF2867 family)
MKIVVIGGSGLIGTKLVNTLRQRGHEVVAASPVSGVNTITGEGLAEALAGAQVIVDVANSPSFEDTAVLHFFETSTRNLLRAAADAGIGHHVTLSVVGADRLPDSGYMRAKVAQKGADPVSQGALYHRSCHAVLRVSGAIAGSSTDGCRVRLPPVQMQPIAADDVVAALLVNLQPHIGQIYHLTGPQSETMYLRIAAPAML